MKKGLSMLLAISLMVTCFAGCGTSASTSTPIQSTATSAASKSEEIVEIRLSSWRVEEIEAFKKINAAFMEEYPNIKPIYESITAAEYDSKLGIDLNAGTAADLYYLRPFDRGYDLYKAGFAQKLTEEMVPNLGNVAPMQKNVYTEKDTGALYGVPYMYINYGFMYNKTMFDELKIKEPETWDDFFAACDTIKANGIVPLAFGIKDKWILSAVASDGNFSAFIGGEEGRQKLLSGELKPTSPEMIEHFATLNRWMDYVDPDFIGIDYVSNVQQFAMGDAAIYPAGSFDLGFVQSQGLDFELGVFAPPVKNAGDKRWTSLNGGAGIAVNPKSEHQKEALIYLNWLMSEKAQTMLGDMAPGLFPCINMDTSKLADPLTKELMSFGGENGELYSICWCLELNSGSPTCTALADDNLYLMMSGKQTPEETAKAIEDGVATWKEEWK